MGKLKGKGVYPLLLPHRLPPKYYSNDFSLLLTSLWVSGGSAGCGWAPSWVCRWTQWLCSKLSGAGAALPCIRCRDREPPHGSGRGTAEPVGRPQAASGLGSETAFQLFCLIRLAKRVTGSYE